MSLRLPFTQSGDTIIEVMLVLSMLGLALSICYATANRSLLNARQAQETSQATVLVQSEIENLYHLASTPASDPNFAKKNIFQGLGVLFCIDSKGLVTNDINPVQFASDCKTQTPDRQNTGIYDLQIQYKPLNGGPGGTFTLTAIWDDVQGIGKDSVTMDYRVYP